MFGCVGQLDKEGVLTISPVQGDSEEGADQSEARLGWWDTSAPWASVASDIKEVKIEGTIKAVTCNGMFASCEALEKLDLSGLDTSAVTDMSWMFGYCSSLRNADLSSLDASHVVNMGYLFYRCSSLRSVGLNGFSSASATSMRYMFAECESSSKLNLSSLNTSRVNDMYAMFKAALRWLVLI